MQDLSKEFVEPGYMTAVETDLATAVSVAPRETQMSLEELLAQDEHYTNVMNSNIAEYEAASEVQFYCKAFAVILPLTLIITYFI